MVRWERQVDLAWWGGWEYGPDSDTELISQPKTWVFRRTTDGHGM